MLKCQKSGYEARVGKKKKSIKSGGAAEEFSSIYTPDIPSLEKTATLNSFFFCLRSSHCVCVRFRYDPRNRNPTVYFVETILEQI